MAGLPKSLQRTMLYGDWHGGDDLVFHYDPDTMASEAPGYMYCSIFSRLISNWERPAVLFFILYAARPPPPTPNRAAPALKVANTASKAVDDAVVAPVRAAIPPIPAASAGAARPP